MGFFDDFFGSEKSAPVHQHSSSTTSAPVWYEDAIKRLIEEARGVYDKNKTYERNPHRQVEPFHPLQSEALQNIANEARDPAYQNLFQSSLDSLHNASALSPLQTVHPLVQRATQNPTERMEPYRNQYQGNIIDKIRHHHNENLNKNVLPSIAIGAIARGAQHSSRVNDLKRDAGLAAQSNLTRDLGNFLYKSEESALDRVQRQQGQELAGAGVLGSAVNSQESQRRAQAQAAQALAASRQHIQGQNQKSLYGAGALPQEQAQRVRDLEAQEFERRQSEPERRLQMESALVRGMPITSQTTEKDESKTFIQPTAKHNAMKFGLNGLSNFGMGGGFMASGGPVRSYAEGGQVQPQPSPYQSQLEAYAAQQQNPQDKPNPMWAWLAGITSGASQASDKALAEGRPMTGLGALAAGTGEATKNVQKQFENTENQKEKAAAIHMKLEESRQLQQHREREYSLAEQRNKIEELGKQAQIKHYGAQEAHWRNMEELASEKGNSSPKIQVIDNKPYSVSTDPETGAPKLTLVAGAQEPTLTASQESSLENADKMINTGLSTEQKLKRQLEISEKIGDHPILGSLVKNLVGVPLLGDILAYFPEKILEGMSDATRAEIREFGNLGSSIVLDTHQGLKNIPRSEGFVNLISQTKQQPGEHSTNKKVGENLIKSAQNITNSGRGIYKRLGKEHESFNVPKGDASAQLQQIDTKLEKINEQIRLRQGQEAR